MQPSLRPPLLQCRTPLHSAALPLQILFEETLYQNASDGTPFVKMLQDKGIVPGIKAGYPASGFPALA